MPAARFSVPDSGTYWVHPHTCLDADYGLHLPLIVDDSAALANALRRGCSG